MNETENSSYENKKNIATAQGNINESNNESLKPFQKKSLGQTVKMKLRLKRDNDIQIQVAVTEETSNKNMNKQLTSDKESFEGSKKITLKCNMKKTDHTNKDCVQKLTGICTKDLEEKSVTTEELPFSKVTEVVPLLHTCEDPMKNKTVSDKMKSKTVSDKIQPEATSLDGGRHFSSDSKINDNEVGFKNSITISKDQILKTGGKNIINNTEVKIPCKKREINDTCKTDFSAKEKTDEGISSSNDILNTDTDLNEIFVRLYKEEIITLSEIEIVKSLPGLSYIIIFTNTRLTKNLLTFDCVLCSRPIGKILSGRVLKSHFSNRSHLLNILKLHDYSLFQKYDRSSVVIDDLYREASNCEVNTEKQVIFAIAQTYSDKRRNICSTIEQLSAHSLKIYKSNHPIVVVDLSDDDDDDDDDDKNTASNLQEFSSPTLNSLNSDLQSPAEQLVKKQKDRHPKGIVFVVDNDVPFKTRQFGELVTVARINNLNFLNAVEKFKEYDLLGKGSLFIICCGIYSLLNISMVDICKLNNCPKPLKSYSVDSSMSSDILVSKALELQAYILANTADDQVMFCDIIPINISNHVMQKCGNKHSLRHYISQDIYVNYLNIIEEYNKFVDIHCELDGFKNLNLLNMLFPLESNNVTRPLNYLYDYTQVDMERVSSSTNEYFSELLKKMAIEIQDIPVVSISTTVTKSKETILKSNVKAFRRVIIITNQQYAIYMNKFKGPKVQVLRVNSNNVNDVALIVKQYLRNRELEFRKTLWLSHADVFKISRTERSKMCFSCAKALNVIVHDKEHLATFADHITKIQGCFETLIKKVNSFLDADSAFVILPPVPLTFLVLENVKHDHYHKIDDGKWKLYHFTTAEGLTQLESLYSKFSKQMVAFSLSEFTKRNIAFQPLADYARIIDSWSSYLNVITSEEVLKLSEKTMDEKYSQWFEHINKIILESLIPKIKENSALEPVKSQRKENNMKSNTLTIFPKTKVRTIPKDYDRIVIICFCQEHTQLLSEEERRDKNISVILMSNTLDCNEMRKKFRELESRGYYDTLFVIIGSMYLLMSEFRENFCRKEKCTDPLYYIKLTGDTKYVYQDIISRVRRFAWTLKVLLRKRSKVIFTPVLTMKCAHKPYIQSAFQHDNAHKLVISANNPCLFSRESEKLEMMTQWFYQAWINEMYVLFRDQLDTHKIRDFRYIINKFKEKSIPLLNLIELEKWSVTTDSYNTECKLFLRKFLDFACPSLENKRKKSVSCTRSVFQPTARAFSRVESSVQSYANANTQINIAQKHNSGYKTISELSSSRYSEHPNIPYAFEGNVNDPDSSVCFYDNAWKDLVTFGWRSSLRYLVGATRGLRKFPPHQKAKILYISSSSKLNDVKVFLFNILNSTGEGTVNLAVLDEHSINADLVDVFMGTPFILANFHWDILRRNDIKALIVDDVMKVLANAEDRITLTSIFRRMNLSENSAVNKVFVAGFYQADIPEYLSSLFGIPLMEDKSADSQPAEDRGFQAQKSPVNMGYPGISNQMTSGNGDYPTIRSRITSGYPADNRVASVYTAVGNEIVSEYPTFSTHGASGHSTVTSQADVGFPTENNQKSSYSCSISDLENQLSLQYSQHPSTYRIRSPTKDKRFPNQESRSLSRNRGSRSLSRNRRSRSLSVSQSYSTRRARSRSRSAMNRSRSRSRRRESHLNFRENRLGSRSGRASQLTFENILRLSRSPGSPLALPYKRLRSRSRSMGHRPLSRNKRFRSRSSSENYRSLLQGKKFCSGFRSKSRSINRSKSRETIQGRDYASNRNSHHDSKSSESNSRDCQFLWQESSSTIPNFSVTGALDLLQQVSHKLGILNPILETLSSTILLELQTNRNKALNFIKETENILLFNMIVNKLKTLLLTASLDEISIISKAIQWTTHLMEYAKNNSQQEANINVGAIAAASVNKTPNFTLNMIKNAFGYEGKENPTAEEINAVFLQVCSLHIEMMMEDK